MKQISYILIFSLLLMSCTASKHLGTTTISKPSMNEPSKEVWFAYWEDQLDGNGGYVPAPFSSEYPQNAVNGYNQAKVEWDKKVQGAKVQTACVWGTAGVGLLVLSTMLLISSVESDLEDAYNY